MTRSTALLALAVLAFAPGCRQRTDGPATIRCAPGETVEIGCAAACGLGTCEGDATLRFCDGALSTGDCAHATDTTTFAQIDDSCGTLCPFGRVTCPASGAITVVPGAIGSGRAVCNWASNELGVLPPGGRGPEIITCTAGTPMRIGCSDMCGIGHCNSGSARIRICDGTVTTSDCQSGPLGNWVLDVTDSSSSSSGSSCDSRCPEAVVPCPASGMLTIAPSARGSSADYWCQWEAVEAPNRADGSVACAPGSRVVVGCAAGCHVGSCLGSGGLRVCDGGLTPADCAAAASTEALAQEFGSSTCDHNCPDAVVVCPASGALTVISRASFSTPSTTEGFGCDWSTRPAGLGE